jgi:hypothetical protein
LVAERSQLFSHDAAPAHVSAHAVVHDVIAQDVASESHERAHRLPGQSTSQEAAPLQPTLHEPPGQPILQVEPVSQVSEKEAERRHGAQGGPGRS